ncbi:MAG: glycosyl transferase family 1, partial [bacterium]|nr:glycosyl transferase family 1 [bacterium]
MNLYYYFRPHLEVFIKPNSVATVHHDLKDNGHDNESFLKSYQKIKKLICLNSLQKIQLKNYNFKGLEIIPHGYYPKLNSFKIINKTHRKKITLGFFSRRYPRKVKGEDLLFKIASCLNTNLYRFILVGQKRSIEYKILIDMGFECELYEFIQYK